MPPSSGIATGTGRGSRPPSDVRPDRVASSRPAAAPAPVRRRDPRLRWAVAAFVGLVLALGIVARFVGPTALWLDEAQSVEIAKLPLPQLFQALREDGSPPLYYLLLHGWIGLFGTGAWAVRSLSGLFSVVTLLLGYRVTRQLAGRRIALVAVLLLASSPFAIRYATEARMYSLLVLLVVLGAMALRAVVRHHGRWPVVALGAVTGALLNTHLWGFNLVAAVGLLALAGLRSRRRIAVRVLLGLVIGGLMFLPWVPSFLVQLAHTGTPWDRQKGILALPVALSAWQGGGQTAAWFLGIAFVLLVVAGLFAVPTLRGSGPRLELVLRLRPSRTILLVTCVGTLVIAGLVSLASSSGVSGRYTSVALPSFLVLVAMGVVALPTVRARALTVVVITGLGLGVAYSGLTTPRTQAAQVASALAAADPGDLVVFCPDQLGPAVSRLAPPDLRLVVYPDLRPAGRIDWTDYSQRVTSESASEVAEAVLSRSAGTAIWVVTSNGYKVPSDDTCREFVQDIAAARGPQTLVVARRTGIQEGGDRLEWFPRAHTP